MGFHIYTDAWWRNPKNAVTTDATIVEIRKTQRFGGNEFKNAGYYHSVVVDVSDPETGEVVRTTGSDVYSWNTAPEGDGGATGLGLAGAISGAGLTPVSGSALSPEKAARVQQVLGAL